MRNLLSREDGIAMPTALGVLLICLIVTALVARGADQLSASSGVDQRAKRALAAADAGVSVAIRRLRSLPNLADAHCLTTTGVAPDSAGVCPPYTEELGGGASFTYRVSPARTAAAGCYEVPGTTVPPGYLRRCITSIGTVGDEVRRVQVQAIVPPRDGGQWIGILGLDKVEIRNSAKLSACGSTEVPGPMVGSNTLVDLDNEAVFNHECADKIWGIRMGPAGTVVDRGAKPEGRIPKTTAPAPFTIPSPPRDFAAVAAVGGNHNDRLTTDTTRANVTMNLNANQRSVRINNSGSLRLHRGGDYILCSLFVDNSGVLDFSTTEKTRIFIDSPNRPGSTCPAGSSGFAPQNGSRINWPASVSDTDKAALSARAKNLEIYVYDSCTTITNTVRFAGLIQSELGTVHFVNSSGTWGAVAAKTVILENSGGFQKPEGLLTWGPDGPPYRVAGWTQCRNVAPVASNPQSGC